MIKRRTKIINEYGVCIKVTEPSAYEIDELLELFSSISERGSISDELIDDFCRLAKISTKVVEDAQSANIIVKVLEAMLELSDCTDILKDVAKGVASEDDKKPTDGLLLTELDFIGNRYKKTPQELYESLSYRQIHYLYVVAYNNFVDELIVKCSIGGATMKNKPKKILAKGLEFMVVTQAEANLKSFRAERIAQGRKHGEGLNNG